MGEFITIGIHIFLFLTLYFEVFLLITFFEADPLRHKKARGTTPARFPTVTIAVPCYNEQNTAAKTIDSLLALDYPADKLTIMVIDDGSTDKTLEALERYRSHPQVQIFHKENGGKHTALNFALEKSDSELFGCLDADSIAASDALREIVRSFEDPEVMAVTPAIQVSKPRTLIQLIQKAEYSLAVFMRQIFAHIGGLFVTPGPLSLFRREVFERVGPYRAAHNTEDLELALRMHTHHLKIANCPTAHVFTNTPPTYPKLFRQRLRWTYGFLKNSIEYRSLYFNRDHGHLGLLVLPIAMTAIFSAIYFAAIFIILSIIRLVAKIVEIQTVGLQAPNFNTAFDWFFFNTSVSIFLIGAILILTTTLIFIGKRIVGEPYRIPYDVATYLALYGFMAPWWLAKAVYNAAVNHQSSWTSERQ